MSGEDESAYFVPVVVSDGREILDRAGKRSLVFDTVFHPSINDRGSKDADYRTFITEIALERIEEKSGLVLGREISTPNISSKGPLTPRTVLVPYFPSNDTQSSITGKPLVEEIDSKPAVTTTAEQTPQWRRDSPGEKGVKGRIIVEVPKLTRTLHSQSTLDIEPNRIILHIPGVYALDIPLDNSGGDHEIDVNEARAQWIVEDKKLVVTW
ncbi:hypothetical protein BOTBODRAFT_461925 [Botryobasidium botryosum FD-172 SS1]|uniref:PIH1 N-terminal domain-containing protein n=1 Tax=Botryobasidium botryosum (strain FD-172 SS1) TaxID=930990 RepID=A0A067M6K8_BOTB1|nr:hypothetical protein BOTBODRAFT_461925 [Botryobasidium botryosum FD-172 SS1]